MICMYDLYDLHSIICNIRFAFSGGASGRKIDRLILPEIIQVLKRGEEERESVRFNQFRIAIQPLLELDSGQMYGFASVENQYTYFPLHFMKNPDLYQTLIKACEQLQAAIERQNFRQVFDLADCLHNLPVMLVEHRYSVPDCFWKNEVKAYRQKWDRNFLTEEEKRIKQNRHRRISGGYNLLY